MEEVGPWIRSRDSARIQALLLADSAHNHATNENDEGQNKMYIIIIVVLRIAKMLWMIHNDHLSEVAICCYWSWKLLHFTDRRPC